MEIDYKELLEKYCRVNGLLVLKKELTCDFHSIFLSKRCEVCGNYGTVWLYYGKGKWKGFANSTLGVEWHDGMPINDPFREIIEKMLGTHPFIRHSCVDNLSIEHLSDVPSSAEELAITLDLIGD